jgi:hypothetical protein
MAKLGCHYRVVAGATPQADARRVACRHAAPAVVPLISIILLIVSLFVLAPHGPASAPFTYQLF